MLLSQKPGVAVTDPQALRSPEVKELQKQIRTGMKKPPSDTPKKGIS